MSTRLIDIREDEDGAYLRVRIFDDGGFSIHHKHDVGRTDGGPTLDIVEVEPEDVGPLLDALKQAGQKPGA